MKHPPQEQDVLSGRLIGGVGFGVVVATIIGVLVAYGIEDCRTDDLDVPMLHGEMARAKAEINAMERYVFTDKADGLAMHRQASEYLSTYGWVDRERGIVHVPIEVAIELLLRHEQARGGTR